MARTMASPRPYPGIAAALLGDPPVLILDEPFNGDLGAGLGGETGRPT
jgi:ABC-type taurine transport system ATPase subunit